MTSWTLRLIFDHPLKQFPTGRKQKGDWSKNWVYREQKKNYMKSKTFFIVFKGPSIGRKKKKNGQKI